ncbi:hypothetical protein COU76_05240 [Candidatus Peregrinibacteria bacterium CG10_big_fil_rev_8_21_14_0_10_49_10]|nr:MAG: hypothetical protein COU76_05240 [Candidatus Peregrinibacteria bacterium CG10_big_fil_rev_8_21_14_0_10_49_10]
MAVSPPVADARIRQIRGKMQSVEGDLAELFAYMDDLPGHQQEQAREALQRAFEMGISLSDLDRMPGAPLLGEQEMHLLGPELRRHILETRKVYQEIAELKQVARHMFGRKTLQHLRRFLKRRRER